MAENPNAVPAWLILRGGAIGDFVLTLPALAALRAHLPGALLELAAYPHVGRLAIALGVVDATRSLDAADAAALFASEPSVREAASGWGRYAAAVSFLHDPGGGVAARLRLAGVARVLTVAPPRTGEPPTSGGCLHAADRLAQPLRAWGVSVEECSVPQVTVPDSLRVGGRRLLPAGAEALVTLHPGSGSPAKNWPLEHFVALADRLRATGMWRPVFVLGEVEDAWRASPGVLGGHAVLPACELGDLCGVLAESRLHIGNDSGITHLAAAVGTPTVALFGPTDPALWAPRGARVQVLRAVLPTTQGLAAMTAADVWCAAQRVMTVAVA